MYGFRARGFDRRESPHAHLADMAAEYVRTMRGVQPDGPYLISGVSFGGLVAFEMARQLRAAGCEVGLLALLDVYAFGCEKLRPIHLRVAAGTADWIRRIRYHIKNLAGSSSPT